MTYRERKRKMKYRSDSESTDQPDLFTDEKQSKDEKKDKLPDQPMLNRDKQAQENKPQPKVSYKITDAEKDDLTLALIDPTLTFTKTFQIHPHLKITLKTINDFESKFLNDRNQIEVVKGYKQKQRAFFVSPQNPEIPLGGNEVEVYSNMDTIRAMRRNELACYLYSIETLHPETKEMVTITFDDAMNDEEDVNFFEKKLNKLGTYNPLMLDLMHFKCLEPMKAIVSDVINSFDVF